MSYRDEFEKIIEQIMISPKAPKEEVDRQFLPLIQFIRNNVPEQLYKFRACTEYSIDAFEKDELCEAGRARRGACRVTGRLYLRYVGGGDGKQLCGD